MYKYTFNNGDVVTSNLKQDELLRRMRRLDTLRVIMEGYEGGEGERIYNKAMRAYHKDNNFTGVIRLSPVEKDFLGYKLEDDSMLTDEDRECIEWYLKR